MLYIIKRYTNNCSGIVSVEVSLAATATKYGSLSDQVFFSVKIFDFALSVPTCLSLIKSSIPVDIIDT